jgi:hypothetical protein
MVKLGVGQLLPTNIPKKILSFLLNPMNIESQKKNEVVPKVRDSWIHVIVISPHHKMRFFFLKIDGLFVVRNNVIRV